MKLLDLEQAAEFLHMQPDTVRRRAAKGEIPGGKPGRQWLFVDADLIEYVRNHYNRKAVYRDEPKQPENPAPITDLPSPNTPIAAVRLRKRPTAAIKPWAKYTAKTKRK